MIVCRTVRVAVLAAFCGIGAAVQAAQPLKIVGPWEVHSIDPASNGVLFTRLQVAESLVDADTNSVLRPGLAESWKVSADQLSWRFVLRKGAQFHDGSLVSAEAVVQALEIALKKPGVMKTAPIKRLVAQKGDVVVELNKPFAPLPAVLAHASAQILAPSSYAADGSVKQVIATGPYRITQLSQPQAVQTARFDKWWGKAPEIGEVSYLSVGRGETRALMAESGQSDITFGLDPVSVGRVKQKGNVQIVSVTLPRTIVIKVNAGHALLKDVAVRQALSLAIDRAGMTRALLRDPEMAAVQLFPPTMADWHRGDVPPLKHDPKQAAGLLAAAGWKAGPDGILVRDGVRLELALRTFPDRPELPPIATAIQDQLRKIGIAVQVKIGNSSEIPAGHRDGTLELGMYARNFALVPDPLISLIDDFSEKGADWGAMNWSSPVVTTALQRLAIDPGANEARAHRAQVINVLQKELPVIPVAWYRQSAAVSKKLEGVALDPLERSYLLTDMRWRKQ